LPGTAASIVPAPAWADIIRPIPLFDVETPELTKLTHGYQARRHQTGGGRQDMLTYGAPDEATYLRVIVYREGSEAVVPAPFFVDIARRAAEAGLSIAKSLPPQAQMTRFGSFEIADLTLQHDQTTIAPCLGFRMGASDAHVQISGLACGVPAKSREGLGCILEHLDLAGAGEDKGLVTFFAASELHRNPACLGGRLVPTPVHAPWLDEKPTPPPQPKRRTARR
jgi:hypothetical protein